VSTKNPIRSLLSRGRKGPKGGVGGGNAAAPWGLFLAHNKTTLGSFDGCTLRGLAAPPPPPRGRAKTNLRAGPGFIAFGKLALDGKVGVVRFKAGPDNSRPNKNIPKSTGPSGKLGGISSGVCQSVCGKVDCYGLTVGHPGLEGLFLAWGQVPGDEKNKPSMIGTNALSKCLDYYPGDLAASSQCLVTHSHLVIGVYCVECYVYVSPTCVARGRRRTPCGGSMALSPVHKLLLCPSVEVVPPHVVVLLILMIFDLSF